MLTEKQQRHAAKQFAETWKDKGFEKGQSQPFWLALLRDVFGVERPEEYIKFEEQVHLDHTSFIDGHISETKVLIEQKSLGKDLNAPIKQSDGSLLTPFQQAKRYITELPVSQHPRWVVTCNFSTFQVYDMERPHGEPEIIELKNLAKEFYRLQFLVSGKDDHIKKELEISVKAGEIVGLLYDALLKQYINPNDPKTLKSLNILCVRLVFCLYAEDAEMFGHKSAFHDYLAQTDAQHLRTTLINLFHILNTPEDKRDPYITEDLVAFPYVNGGLFAQEDIEIPQFTEDIREILLTKASANFDWADISPTIFGALFESTLNPETRRKGGMHYTSIENIHKVIDPLFLDDLRKELDNILQAKQNRDKKLQAYQDKLASLAFLDPACGSGNFLTETYLSLRRLENAALRYLQKGSRYIGSIYNPIKVSIGQFYGIEINDFAVSVAKTALWIAEAQMLKETEDIVGMDLDFFPLKSYANIVEGNALRMDWNSIIAKDKLSYIMGNPPFVGQAMRTKEQTDDMREAFAPSNDYGKLDYVTSWFKKAVDFIINTQIDVAFVSSNSICQGETVSLFWKKILSNGIYINFAYTTFPWQSEAKTKAAVMCVIVGFSYKESKEKILFIEGKSQIVGHINGYLNASPDVYITNRSKSINKDLASVFQGSPPADDGRLLLSIEERDVLISKHPELADVLLPFVGSREFINDIGFTRYCIWLVGKRAADYAHIPELTERFRYVSEYRRKSPVDRIQKTADKPYLFTQNRQPTTDFLLIPRVSSSSRLYIPIGLMPPSVIASDATVLIDNATLYNFGLISSSVHNAWIRVVAGRLKNDYRYSPSVYYNFPMPTLTEHQKEKIETTARNIIEARKIYSDKSLADMYGTDMYLYPELYKAHQENDKAVLETYGLPKNSTESDIVAHLFKMYQQLTKEK